ncbi:MAG TPA: c-type cytochrome biogenesis protein CcmI [Candidatus Limnocylindria bacterium]
MPDIGQWALLVAIGIAVAAVVAWPLLTKRAAGPGSPDARAEAEARALRHRVALEALLDVEADRRAGSLDDASYERERSEAEARAAETLEEGKPANPPPAGVTAVRAGRRLVIALATVVVLALVVGFAVPGSIGLGQRTVVDQALADQLAQASANEADIQRLLGLFAANPSDPQVVSDLADAYLAGGTADDLQRAAVALQVLIALQPENHSAYRRLINAYIVAGDYADAGATTDSYAGIAGLSEPDIPFYRGLIAFRQGDNASAVEEFDRFLALAPDDGRASMVSSLRAEAAGALPGASSSPGG